KRRKKGGRVGGAPFAAASASASASSCSSSAEGGVAHRPPSSLASLRLGSPSVRVPARQSVVDHVAAAIRAVAEEVKEDEDILRLVDSMVPSSGTAFWNLYANGIIDDSIALQHLSQRKSRSHDRSKARRLSSTKQLSREETDKPIELQS